MISVGQNGVVIYQTIRLHLKAENFQSDVAFSKGIPDKYISNGNLKKKGKQSLKHLLKCNFNNTGV